jgi:hypothetical protein
LDVEDIEAVAEHIAQLVAPTPLLVVLVDAQDLAEQLGVSRTGVTDRRLASGKARGVDVGVRMALIQGRSCR